jgi:hypothetical protein
MEDKISQQAISRYSRQYSRKILDRFFAGKAFINGQEILALTEVEQINLFIIQALFRTWKDEIQKSRSVYFDYEAKAVIEAQQNLMNVLSRNIRVNRQHLEPLLLQATSHTLNDVLNPYDFFSKLITGSGDQLSVAAFKEDLKYIKLNKAPLQQLLNVLQERKIETITGNEAFAMLDKILEEINFSPEDIDPLLDKLSVLEPVTIEAFYEVQRKMPVTTPPFRESKAVPVTKDSKTIVDDFQKISAIKDSLTINQKFMFTKALFAGDFERFSEVVSELDKRTNFNDAMNYLDKFLRNWDQESEEFHEFMEMVEKRFA